MTIAILIAATGAGALAVTAGPSPNWTWAFPPGGPFAKPDDKISRTLPGSSAHFTDVQIADLTHAVDWRPGDHPVMADAVAVGRGGAHACGYCHLPTGEGRPENEALAGLSADYIARQVAAFASGSRQSAQTGSMPVALMTATARIVPPADIAKAAAYFSQLHFTSHVTVIEAAQIPHTRPAKFVYVLNSGLKELLGQRIVEVPDSTKGFEMRDPHMTYTAYVPVGAITAGAALVKSGSCSGCHGAGLKGGFAPPLAGRSPTGLFRQLLAFKLGTRASPEAAAMRTIAGPLSEPQMIALAAYASAQKP